MPRVLTQFCVPSYRLPLLPHFKRNGRELRYRPTSAKKSNAGGNSQTKESSPFSLRISRAFVAKSAIIVFGLGFLDAAYSGDWSRIGVISKEVEEVLKVASYLVVPLCFLLAIFISDDERPCEL